MLSHQVQLERALTVEHARYVVNFLLELKHAKHAQEVDVQTTVFLKKVKLVLVATVPHLLTVKKLARVKGIPENVPVNQFLRIQSVARPNDNVRQRWMLL